MIAASRVKGWRTALAATLLAAPQRPFSWELQHDCCLGLVVPAVNSVIGVDLGGPYRGQYTTALGALKALKSQGYDSLVDLAAATFESASTGMARPGDIAAIKTVETGWGLGIVTGPRIAVLAPTGFATINLLAADHVYRVGK